MKLLVTIGLVGAMTLGLGSSVGAATLYTAPLPGGGAGVYCQVVNVSTVPHTVTITIRDANGMQVNSQTCPGLPASNSCTLAVPGAGTAPHSCRIDVDATRTTVRGSIVRLYADGTPAIALPAE